MATSRVSTEIHLGPHCYQEEALWDLSYAPSSSTYPAETPQYPLRMGGFGESWPDALGPYTEIEQGECSLYCLNARREKRDKLCCFASKGLI